MTQTHISAIVTVCRKEGVIERYFYIPKTLVQLAAFSFKICSIFDLFLIIFKNVNSMEVQPYTHTHARTHAGDRYVTVHSWLFTSEMLKLYEVTHLFESVRAASISENTTVTQADLQTKLIQNSIVWGFYLAKSERHITLISGINEVKLLQKSNIFTK